MLEGFHCEILCVFEMGIGVVVSCWSWMYVSGAIDF